MYAECVPNVCLILIWWIHIYLYSYWHNILLVNFLRAGPANSFKSDSLTINGSSKFIQHMTCTRIPNCSLIYLRCEIGLMQGTGYHAFRYLKKAKGIYDPLWSTILIHHRFAQKNAVSTRFSRLGLPPPSPSCFFFKWSWDGFGTRYFRISQPNLQTPFQNPLWMAHETTQPKGQGQISHQVPLDEASIPRTWNSLPWRHLSEAPVPGQVVANFHSDRFTKKSPHKSQK